MRSSIFSSETTLARRWILILVVAVGIWSIGLLGFESRLRALGHTPSIVDSDLLWSAQREKVDRPEALVFIGASRTLFGIDLAVVGNLLPTSYPIMLALNGRYPLATLRRLSEEDDFRGTVMVDIDARGLSPYNWEAQDAANRYFEDTWSPNWHLHRSLLNHLQSNFVFMNPRLGAIPFIRALSTDGPLPYVAHDRLTAEREGSLYFDRTSPEGLAEMFRVGLIEDLTQNPPPAQEQWLLALAPVAQWAARIEERGGKVIFYIPPVSGDQRILSDQAYPRKRYWQRFIDHYGLRGWHFEDNQAMLALPLPDSSHVNHFDKENFTSILIRALQDAGWL